MVAVGRAPGAGAARRLAVGAARPAAARAAPLGDRGPGLAQRHLRQRRAGARVHARRTATSSSSATASWCSGWRRPTPVPDDLDGQRRSTDKPPGLATLSPALARQLDRLDGWRAPPIGADRRRDRHRQGAGGAGGARAVGPARGVRGRQLRRAARSAGRGRAVRPPPGRVLRRGGRADRATCAPPTAARCSSTRSPTCACPSQAALLRVLQEREVVPLGAERPIAVDVRFCAATHRALAELVAAGAVPRATCTPGCAASS